MRDDKMKTRKKSPDEVPWMTLYNTAALQQFRCEKQMPPPLSYKRRRKKLFYVLNSENGVPQVFIVRLSHSFPGLATTHIELGRAL